MDEGQLKGREQIEHGEDPAVRSIRRGRAESSGLVISQIVNRYQQISIPDDRAVRNPWIVVRTKVKCEKFIRDRLQTMGLEAFVPLRKRTAKYNRKVKVYELPLITGYTFVRLDKTRRNEVLALPYVQGMLRIAGHDCIVSDREIQWLQKISGTDIEVRTETLSMKQGDRVILAYGQLAGMEGVIMSQRSKHEMVVALESIGIQMVVQVDPSMLELAW
ncbi:MAG: UpxY family transcription antiterminator [Saprospiraceae bacterium]